MPRQLGVVTMTGLGVLVLAYAGVFRSLDGWLFDRLVELSPSPTLSSQGIVVVASERDLEESEILDLAKNLNRQGARATIFARSGSEALDLETYEKLLEWKACVTWEAGAPWSASPPPGGIWRGIDGGWPQGVAAPSDGKPRIAKLLGFSTPQDNQYLDFRVKRDGFQRVEVDRLLEGDVPRSLVAGKVVLVGRDSPAESLITTPVHRGQEALSPLLLQAAVIDALDRGGMVSLASPATQWISALALAAVLVCLLALHARASTLWLTIAGCALVVVAAWVALWQFQWWIPPAKSIILLGAAGSVTAGARAAAGRTALRRTLRNLAVDAQERSDQGRFLTSVSPWPLVEEMLRHSFSFKQGFVLRLDASSGKLEAVSERGAEACRQCLAESSLHRDREPFLTAARNKCTTLEDGLVVQPIGEAGRLFGFWVFHPETPAAIEQAGAYASRVGAMFERRERWRERARPRQLEDNDGSALRVRPLHDQLEGSMELLEGGRKVLANVLDRSMEAVLAYGPFGHLIHVSGSAAEMLAAADVDFANAPPVDLIARLTGRDADEIRRALRFVALRGENTALRATRDLVPGREYLVHIRSLHEPFLTGLDTGPGLPGVVVLIQDVTQTARAALLKDEFFERVYFQLANDFEAVLAASALLDDPRIDAEERAELLTVINEKVVEAAARMKETRAHLGAEFSRETIERYPVRFEPFFDAAKAAVEAELEAHKVTIEADLSDYLQLVLAAPQPLEELLHAMLLTLIHDSREDSRITIEASQEERKLCVAFTNEGFGMPQDKLVRYLQDGADGHETLERIGAGVVAVAAWGGTLAVHSEVGAGMTFELKLVSVI